MDNINVGQRLLDKNKPFVGGPQYPAPVGRPLQPFFELDRTIPLSSIFINNLKREQKKRGDVKGVAGGRGNPTDGALLDYSI